MHRSLLAVSLLFSASCAPTPTAAVDPLTSVWSNSSCYSEAGMPSEVLNCELKLDFAVSLDFTLTDTRVIRPANATYPGCTVVRRVTGLRYSTTIDMEFTLSGTPASTLERSGCLRPEDNSPSMPTSAVTVLNGTRPFVIAGNTLTIASGPLAGMYTR